MIASRSRTPSALRLAPPAAIVAVAAGVVATAAPARADEPASGRAAAEYVVEPGGSASFEVPVNAAFVTVLYFPDRVVSAVASDKRRFDIRARGDTVTLRPRTEQAGVTANLNVQTESLKVSVILKTVPKSHALAQVVFKRADAEAEFERRVRAEVDRRTRELERAIARRRAQLDDEVARRARADLAARALARLETQRLTAIARNDDNVIVRVPQVAFIGDDAYLFFEIQNRDRTPYRVARVDLHHNGKPVGGPALLAGGGGGGLLGTVPSGKRVRGVVVVPSALRLAREPLTLTVSEPDGRRRVVVDEVVLP